MNDPRFCIICDQVVDISDMTVISKSHGGRGRTIVIDPTTEKSHIVLSKSASARKAAAGEQNVDRSRNELFER